ncbi:MAG: hypothetical protein ACR2QC_05730 [Gammaproteobacteria bacterium]
MQKKCKKVAPDVAFLGRRRGFCGGRRDFSAPPPDFRPPHSPIPAKAGISAAAKRRVIVNAFGDEIPAFAGMELKRFRSPRSRG